MQLLKFFLVFSLCSAAAKEVCIAEDFNATCSAGEVVSIESAIFGRMHDNRCINLTDNESICSADIRSEMQMKYGLKGSIHFKLSSDFFTTKTPTCLNGRMPFLEFYYQCTKSISNEVCIQGTFNAACQAGTVIHIQSALYGRMRSSLCTDFENKELNCYANVQSFLGSVCNGLVECNIKASNDTLREAESTCSKRLKPYLEVFYTCAYEFDCPPFNLPTGAKKRLINNGYNVTCDSKSSKTVLCIDGNWNIDPEKLCPTNGLLQLLLFSSIAGVFMLTAIIAVVVCLRRIQKKKKTNVTRNQAQVGEDYSDYPVSHLRRQGGTCGSEDEYEYEYEYDVQQEDGTYGCYSHVRDTGP